MTSCLRAFDIDRGRVQTLLIGPTFLESLQTYDKDAIDPDVMEALQPILTNPDCEPDAMRKVSKAAAGLCSWVQAIAAYHLVAKLIAPKRAALTHAEGDVTQLRDALAVKQTQVEQVRALSARVQGGLGAHTSSHHVDAR